MLHRLHCHIKIAVGGDHDHHCIGIQLENTSKPVKTLLTTALSRRKIHIKQDDIKVVGRQQAGNPGGVITGLHMVELALEQQFTGGQDIFVIVDD